MEDWKTLFLRSGPHWKGWNTYTQKKYIYILAILNIYILLSELCYPRECRQPCRRQERWVERKRWETGRERVLGRRERRRLRQTVWLHWDLQHSASYDSQVRGYPGWWISGQRLIYPHKRKGSCFHSERLESLFQESVLPTADCKPVSLQRSFTSPQILSLPFLLFFYSFIGLPKCRETPSHAAHSAA